MRHAAGGDPCEDFSHNRCPQGFVWSKIYQNPLIKIIIFHMKQKQLGEHTQQCYWGTVAGVISMPHWELKRQDREVFRSIACRSTETLLPLKMRELSPRDTLQEQPGESSRKTCCRWFVPNFKAMLVQVSYTNVLVYTWLVVSCVYFSILLPALCVVELVLLWQTKPSEPFRQKHPKAVLNDVAGTCAC